MPKRIQRKRTKGWRMPEGAVYVGRPSRWGNPYPIAAGARGPARANLRARATEAFRQNLYGIGWNATRADWEREIRRELRGRDLACWCPLDQPCHADVLLEVANR